MMKKRWISLYVENEIGVLARISGLFSSKSYNLNSLTVGTTEDPTISRMTISVISDDQTFEQIKKQLNRSVEVIKVIDITGLSVHRKELMFIRVHSCGEQDVAELFRIASVYRAEVIEYQPGSVTIESVRTEEENNELILLLKQYFPNRLLIVRGGSVAIEGGAADQFS